MNPRKKGANIPASLSNDSAVILSASIGVSHVRWSHMNEILQRWPWSVGAIAVFVVAVGLLIALRHKPKAPSRATAAA
jgi:hypothetical protein